MYPQAYLHSLIWVCTKLVFKYIIIEEFTSKLFLLAFILESKEVQHNLQFKNVGTAYMAELFYNINISVSASHTNRRKSKLILFSLCSENVIILTILCFQEKEYDLHYIRFILIHQLNIFSCIPAEPQKKRGSGKCKDLEVAQQRKLMNCS